MTQHQIIDDLLENHSLTLIKHLPDYKQIKGRKFIRSEVVQHVLNELAHCRLSENTVLKAFDRLDQALQLETIYYGK